MSLGIKPTDLGNSQMMASERVKKENVGQIIENQKKAAEVDGNNNIIMVKDEGAEATVTSVKLGKDVNLASLAIGKDAKLGEATGVIRFLDNGEDDKSVLELKKAEATIAQAQKPQPAAAQTAPQTVDQVSEDDKIYNLSPDQAFKSMVVLALLGQDITTTEFKKNFEEIKGKDLTSREKTDMLKDCQELFAERAGETDFKGDGKWGMSTFLNAKIYCHEKAIDATTDKEFRKIIDDMLKLYDGSISLEKFNEKYEL